MPARLQVLLAAICFGTTGTAQASARPPRPSRWAPRGSSSAACCSCSWRAACACACRASSAPLIGHGGGRRRLPAVLLRRRQAHRRRGRHRRRHRHRPRRRRRARAPRQRRAAERALGAGDGPRRRSASCCSRATAAASVDPTGVALAVTSGVGYATYTVLSKRMLDAGEAPEGVMAAGFGGAGLLLLPVLLVAGPGFLATPGGLALALYLAADPDRAGLRALLARPASPVERRDGHARPRRAAHRGGARGRRARRAPVARRRDRRAARARRTARARRARGAGAGSPRRRRRHERHRAAARLDRRPARPRSCASASSTATSSPASG